MLLNCWKKHLKRHICVKIRNFKIVIFEHILCAFSNATFNDLEAFLELALSGRYRQKLMEERKITSMKSRNVGNMFILRLQNHKKLLDFCVFHQCSRPILNIFLTILDIVDTIFVSFWNSYKYVFSRATSRNASKELIKAPEEAHVFKNIENRNPDFWAYVRLFRCVFQRLRSISGGSS